MTIGWVDEFVRDGSVLSVKPGAINDEKNSGGSRKRDWQPGY
jgi:hypothetical protein